MVRGEIKKISSGEIAEMTFSGYNKKHVVKCTVDSSEDAVRCTIDDNVAFVISEPLFNRIAIINLQDGKFLVYDPFKKDYKSMENVQVEWV